MIISTKTYRPFTTSFMLFNFVVFWFFKFTLLDRIAKYTSPLHAFGVDIVLAFITGFVFILIRGYFVGREERVVMKGSKYFKKHNCNLFVDYDVPFILKIGRKTRELYINQVLLFPSQYYSNSEEVISELKERVLTLNKLDLLCIYLYKYMETVLMSLLFFVIWYLCELINMKNALNEIVLIMAISVVMTLAYFKIMKIIKSKLKKFMMKHDLDVFV